MQIFISYVNQDRVLAKILTSQLTRSGLSVWNPDEAIEPGDNWATKLGQALGESDVMVVLFSREARNSDAIRRDVEYALTSKNYGQRLVPVLIDIATFVAGEDVPWILAGLNQCEMVQSWSLNQAAISSRSSFELNCSSGKSA